MGPGMSRWKLPNIEQPDKDWDEWTLTEAVEVGIRYTKAAYQRETLTPDQIINQISILQDGVQQLKKNGISVWNYKSVIPKIFDLVDANFLILQEIVNKLDKKE